MNAATAHLVSKLEAMLASLDAGDAEVVAGQLDELSAAFSAVKNPGSDPRVVELFKQCQGKANQLHARLSAELGSHATSRRAASAYGSQP
ncbi:MAG: hypothetical protein JNM69_22995 [Archangium sp.]|nr:hypothetical protein [Archangium sp.]